MVGRRAAIWDNSRGPLPGANMTSERRTASSPSHNAPCWRAPTGMGAQGGHGQRGGRVARRARRGGVACPGIGIARRGEALAGHRRATNAGPNERGRPQTMDRRLFMQFLAFHTSAATPRMGVESLASAFTERRIAAVVYDDVQRSARHRHSHVERESGALRHRRAPLAGRFGSRASRCLARADHARPHLQHRL